MTDLNPLAWHNHRRKSIISEYNEIHELYGYDKSQILRMVIISITMFSFMYLSSILNIWYVIFAAATVGAFCRMRVFNIMHELCHDLVHPKITGVFKSMVMVAMQIPYLNSFYPYYRWYHISHHGKLGLQSKEEAFEKIKTLSAADGDVLGNFNARRVNKLDIQPTSTAWLSTPLRRFIYFGIFFPIEKIITGVISMTILPIYTLVTWKYNNINLTLQMLGGVVDSLLNLTVVTTLVYFFGWKSLVYLALSELFMWGFLLYPTSAFWTLIHKSHDSSNGCQPTTSVYGALITFICGGVNYHTEHHDFVRVPCRKLKELNKIGANFYNDIVYYSGYFELHKVLCFDPCQKWVYACQNHTYTDVVA